MMMLFFSLKAKNIWNCITCSQAMIKTYFLKNVVHGAMTAKSVNRPGTTKTESNNQSRNLLKNV